MVRVLTEIILTNFFFFVWKRKLKILLIYFEYLVYFIKCLHPNSKIIFYLLHYYDRFETLDLYRMKIVSTQRLFRSLCRVSVTVHSGWFKPYGSDTKFIVHHRGGETKLPKQTRFNLRSTSAQVLYTNVVVVGVVRLFTLDGIRCTFDLLNIASINANELLQNDTDTYSTSSGYNTKCPKISDTITRGLNERSQSKSRRKQPHYLRAR